MAITLQRRRELLEMNLPASNAVRKQLQDYLQRTGLDKSDFARRINYARVTIGHFLNGRYAEIASNDRPLCAAIVEFIRNHPVAAPQEVRGTLHDTEAVRLMRRYFHAAVEEKKFAACVAGGPGMGKTSIFQHLIAELNRRELPKNGQGKRAYYVYCANKVTPNQLLKDIAIATGCLAVGDNRRIIRNLRFDFMNRDVALIFDEAQHLSDDCFETLMELYNLPPHFGMIFTGTHHLAHFLNVHRFDLEQVNRRMRTVCQLPGLSEDEALAIVKEELPALSAKQREKLITLSWTEATGYVEESEAGKKKPKQSGIMKYISAGRLFDAISAWKKDTAKGATA